MKLCKVTSNSDLVRQAYPPEDKEQTVKALGPGDFNTEQPEQRNTALVSIDILYIGIKVKELKNLEFHLPAWVDESF